MLSVVTWAIIEAPHQSADEDDKLTVKRQAYVTLIQACKAAIIAKF